MTTLRRVTALGGLLLAGAAAAEESPLARCAAMDDAAARLACYDTLAGRAPAAPAAVPDSFGKRIDEQASSFEARIPGPLRTWKRGTVFKLDNGQAWQVIEDNERYYSEIPENPEVVVSRNFYGYWLTIKAINRKIAVKRVS